MDPGGISIGTALTVGGFGHFCHQNILSVPTCETGRFPYLQFLYILITTFCSFLCTGLAPLWLNCFLGFFCIFLILDAVFK